MSHRYSGSWIIRASLMSMILCTVSGCKLLSWINAPAKPTPIARVLKNDADLDEITDHLNRQRGKILSWKSTNVRIVPTGKILSPKLTGNLTVEGPKNLRLVAESIIGPEVDFGSNSEDFWFWVKRSDPKHLLTGSHEGLAQQSMVQLPFPPEWLMEALGVVPIDTTEAQMMRSPEDSKVKLVSARYIQGQQVQRVLIIDMIGGQVVEHALLDAENNLICRATMSDFQRPSKQLLKDSAGHEIRLPHTVNLIWPQAEMNLTMTISDIELNPQVSKRLWKMTEYPGYRVVNIDDVRSQQ